MFRLTKWYLDLVTDQGTALIVYAASIEATALRVRFAATLLAPVDTAPVERTAWSGVDLPELTSEVLRFEHRGLALAGQWHRAAAPIEETLLDDDRGQLHWACLLPNATATVALGGERFTGAGYAECLTMTRPPWALPFRELRWGRWTSPAHNAVWIQWSDGPSRQWVWLDGAAEPGAALSDLSVRNLSQSSELRITPMRELCDRRALRVVTGQLPALEPLLAGPLANLREVKRLDRGILVRDGAPDEEGWVIHEVVRW